MRDRKERELIKSVGKEHNLSQQQVTEIIDGVFDYVVMLMQKGLFEGVMIPFLGKFWVKQQRLNIVQHNAAKANKSSDPTRSKRNKTTSNG